MIDSIRKVLREGRTSAADPAAIELLKLLVMLEWGYVLVLLIGGLLS